MSPAAPSCPDCGGELVVMNATEPPLFAGFAPGVRRTWSDCLSCRWSSEKKEVLDESRQDP